MKGRYQRKSRHPACFVKRYNMKLRISLPPVQDGKAHGNDVPHIRVGSKAGAEFN